ncbi:MAG TPA: tetratricopeptide repeat protein [Chthoniobacter sp.]|jgi:predicted O-linked N-acetylglucosamine transferase (SPINDLY family)
MTVTQAFEHALQLQRAGMQAEAEVVYRQIIAAEPHHSGALLHLGFIANDFGHHDHALEWIHRAIHFQPDNPAAHSALAMTLVRLRRLDEAAAAFRRAIELNPHDAESHNNLGNTLREHGKSSEAVEAYRRALQLKPDFATAYYNLATTLTELAQFDDAIDAYRRALAIQPEHPAAWYNLGIVLRKLERLDEAVAAFRRAVELSPKSSDASFNLAKVLHERGDLDGAIAAYAGAIALEPDSADAHNNLGQLFAETGRIEEALAEYRRAGALVPQCAWMQSNVIFTLLALPGQDVERFIPEELQLWNRRFGHPAKQFASPYLNDRAPERRLRIGYLSPDLRDHVVGRNVKPLFDHHDHHGFEVFCYSGVTKPDALTEGFRRCADQWRDTEGLPDEMLAEMIHCDRIDILVDLSQHTAGNRLPVFAHHPAPIQVSFAGYPGSTGLDAISCRISDRWLESEMEDRSSGDSARPNSDLRTPISDRQVFLLDSFWCYDPCGANAVPNDLPANKDGYVTFGSLNSFYKVNPPLLRLWSQVLIMVKNSRLLILSRRGHHREQTLDLLQQEGIDPSRVDFVEPRPRREYLEFYHRVDLVLDTYPYNGHTTSLDALWMGVPVITFVGTRPVSRGGFSQLSNLGLAELAAFSEEEYVRIAARIASDLPRLADLRATLRSRMETSVLMNSRHFARQIEAAYRAMWQQWCRENPA